MIRRQIQLSESQDEAVKRHADRRGVSRSAVVREAIDAYLGHSAPLVDRGKIRERAKSLIGAFGGGPADVSDRHDEYLAHVDPHGSPDE